MSKFVRPSAWLRQLFTQSQTEHVHPTRVSDDVSLVQPYDGGGMFLSDPSSWGTIVAGGVAAAGVVSVVTVPENQIYRILSVGAVLQAGGAPGTAWWNIVLPDSGVFPITTNGGVSGTLFASWGSSILLRQFIGRQILQFQWAGGDASTQIDLHVLGIFAPAGTVFYN